MTDSPNEKRVKQAVGDVIRKYSYPSGAIDMPGDEARQMQSEINAAISKALPEQSIPDQGSWFRTVEPLIWRCEVAVAVGGDAVWNSVDAQAHGELLREMARILDSHIRNRIDRSNTNPA